MPSHAMGQYGCLWMCGSQGRALVQGRAWPERRSPTAWTEVQGGRGSEELEAAADSELGFGFDKPEISQPLASQMTVMAWAGPGSNWGNLEFNSVSRVSGVSREPDTRGWGCAAELAQLTVRSKNRRGNVLTDAGTGY